MGIVVCVSMDFFNMIVVVFNYLKFVLKICG